MAMDGQNIMGKTHYDTIFCVVIFYTTYYIGVGFINQQESIDSMTFYFSQGQCQMAIVS